MSVTYCCRHCGTFIGKIENSGVTEFQLGFHFLTPEERRDIITYNQEGDIFVKTICDYCKEAIDTHPELSLVASPLQ